MHHDEKIRIINSGKGSLLSKQSSAMKTGIYKKILKNYKYIVIKLNNHKITRIFHKKKVL